MITMDRCCDSKACLPRMAFLDEPLARFEASLEDCLDPDEPGMRRWDSFADVVAQLDDGRHKVDWIYPDSVDRQGLSPVGEGA